MTPERRKRWKWDAERRRATHGTGLVVQFVDSQPGKPDKRVDGWLPNLPMDQFARLMAEAGEIGGRQNRLVVSKVARYCSITRR